ncbi:MAG: glycosyltransferase [Anaerolineales bacterium]
MTTVSVIVPAYNQSRFLGAALESIFNQDFEDFELVVVDDGSTDETADVVRSYKDARLHYYFQPNSGLSAARNTGIRKSSGEFLAFLDADDLFLPSKLTSLLRAFHESPELGLVAGQAILIDESGRRIGKTFSQGPPNPIERMLLGNPLHVGSVLLRHGCQEKVGYFDEMLQSYEDWDYWLRLAYAGCRIGWVDEPVSMYRFHQDQMTRDGETMTAAVFSVLNKFYFTSQLRGEWRSLRNEAYSRAHLRAAAQDFAAQNYDQANAHLGEAAKLNPKLLEDGGRPLADHFMAWIELPKFRDPLGFLNRIYSNLSDRFLSLKLRRRSELSKAAMMFAFDAYQVGDLRRARQAIVSAIRHDPKRLRDRGTISVLLRAYRIVPL